MIFTQYYYDQDDSDPEIETTTGNVNNAVKRFDYILIKDLETSSVSKTKVELQAQDKGSEGFYSFIIEGEQKEIEEFLEAMYLESKIYWKAEHAFIPQKGNQCFRKTDNQLFFITKVESSRVSLCSTNGELIENLYVSHFKEQFKKENV